MKAKIQCVVVTYSYTPRNGCREFASTILSTKTGKQRTVHSDGAGNTTGELTKHFPALDYDTVWSLEVEDTARGMREVRKFAGFYDDARAAWAEVSK
jgi:hypothetical protein